MLLSYVILCYFIQQIVGIVIFIMGIWAWTEKDTFSNLSRVAQVPLDPALFFIIVGFIIYIIGFLGCVGALRENTVLLFVVSAIAAFNVGLYI